MNPVALAILVLGISLTATLTLFLTTLSSWLSFIVILTFSSGMMTLFMYTASLSANEKSKETKMGPTLLMILLLSSMTNNTAITQKETMKLFTNNIFLSVTALILIITMLSITMHGHHPHQTTSSSF